jgi:hypothetical protein
LLQKGVKFFPDRIVLEIRDNTVVVADKFTEIVGTVGGYDTLVLAMGNIADDKLYNELKGRLPVIHRIGDCVAPRRLDMAILEGNKVALSI